MPSNGETKLQFACNADTVPEMLSGCLRWLYVRGVVTDGERDKINARIRKLAAKEVSRG